MQNKANLPNTQMNITTAVRKDYENERLRTRAKNKANSNPICSELVEPVPKGNPWLIPNARVLQETSNFVEFLRYFVKFCRIFYLFLRIFTAFSPLIPADLIAFFSGIVII
ncbi:MAG: hypothetical protein ACYSSL_01685 [Planctomycetota bacterium]|jgi:hypothetical protein